MRLRSRWRCATEYATWPIHDFSARVVPVLVQALVHAQERVLAQLAGVLGVADHALDDVPAQALVLAHEPFERAGHVAQHGGHQARRSFGHGAADTPGGGAGCKSLPAPRRCNRRRRPPVSIVRERHTHPASRTAMNFEILIPITLFICIVYAIKVVVDARVRRRWSIPTARRTWCARCWKARRSSRRHASLRWGIILVALALRLRRDPGARLERSHARRDRGRWSARPAWATSPTTCCRASWADARRRRQPRRRALALARRLAGQHLAGRLRLADQVALRITHAEFAQALQLLARFHAFADDLGADAVRHRDDRSTIAIARGVSNMCRANAWSTLMNSKSSLYRWVRLE